MPRRKVFVSGCYDLLHAGHVQFFTEARALGDHLTVCFASEEVLWQHKQRRSSLPDEHKQVLLSQLRMVDEVVVGSGLSQGLDFEEHFRRVRPDVLAVTEDDQYGDVKRALCEELGVTYHILAKTPPQFEAVSSSGLVKWIQAPEEVPLRVDFGGGWLDVPRFAREGTFIVNCAISPLVSRRHWPYQKRSGLGGSGAWALLRGEDPVRSEIELGVGWQDPAVIRETGLCVWKSGPRPRLDLKRDGELLQGRLALFDTGVQHDTPALADRPRDFERIAEAGAVAREAVLHEDLALLARAVRLSMGVQRDEGMEPLPDVPGMLAAKYCGGGFGGYAVYLFPDRVARDAAVAARVPELTVVEPYRVE